MGYILAALALILLSALPAAAQRVTIAAGDCARLVQHVPAPDVAYRPGVDARGRPVAPADLPGTTRIEVPDPITFDVAVDLRPFGLAPNSLLFEPHVDLGRITIERDGRAYFNGQPLQNADTDALAQYCRQRMGTGR